MMRILLVEDELVVARSVAALLSGHRITTDIAGSGEDGLDHLRTYTYDAVVLDRMLPDMDGLEFVRRVRTARITTPILMLSGHGDTATRVKGITLGADDFLTKPFEPQELVARLLAIVRRASGFADQTLRAGPLEMDLKSHDCKVNGRHVHLTGKEQAILQLMMTRKGMVLSKEAILTHLYGGMDEPEIKIVDVFVCKLRKKLASAGSPNLIGTVWGRGYILREPGSNEARMAMA
jgi:two-component system cell cycle response regulator CtrA